MPERIKFIFGCGQKILEPLYRPVGRMEVSKVAVRYR